MADLVHATRQPGSFGPDLGRWIEIGASPRASLALDRCGRAHAWLRGRDYVDTLDIRAIAPNVFRHRLRQEIRPPDAPLCLLRGRDGRGLSGLPRPRIAPCGLGRTQPGDTRRSARALRVHDGFCHCRDRGPDPAMRRPA
ncbi:AAA family ATPase [Jhaorihella thermophila]|uniref:AAA family ATPase n=1 Tax=Jhaorihella thermophila TaxID=488547 RepID=UPI002E1676BC